MPSSLKIGDLKPSRDLLGVFEECHNAIYANDGLLKDRIFNEITKLLIIKLTDEQRGDAEEPLFVPGNGQLHPRFIRLIELTSERHPDLLAGPDDLVLSPTSLQFVVDALAGISILRSPGDVKGQAFQTFVNRHQRGDRGEFFTPHPVVGLAVAVVDPQPEESVLDPACGSGGFLLDTVAHVRRSNKEPGRSYVRDQIRGWEFNPEVARAAALRLEFEGGSGTEVSVVNSLLAPDRAAGEFDVILTNPPFGSKGKIDDASILRAYDLGHRWKKRADGWEQTDTPLAQTPEILFIELCVRLLREGGRMAIVVPDGLLQNSSAAYVRQWLRARCDVLAVISFPQQTFVPFGTGIKTSVLVVRRSEAQASSHDSACFMGCIRAVGYDSKGKTVYRQAANGESHRAVMDDCSDVVAAWQAFGAAHDITNDERLAFVVPPSELNSRLDVEHYLPTDLRLIKRLRRDSARPLGDYATVLTKRANLKLLGSDLIRYVAISNIDAATMRIVSQDEVAANDAPSRATYVLEEGDLLTAVSGASTGTSRHVVACVGPSEAGAFCSNGLAVIRDVEDIEPLYLLAFMRSEAFLRQVRRLRTGHAIPAISLEDLRSILVPVPDHTVQHAVASRVQEMFRLRDHAATLGTETVALLQFG